MQGYRRLRNALIDKYAERPSWRLSCQAAASSLQQYDQGPAGAGAAVPGAVGPREQPGESGQSTGRLSRLAGVCNSSLSCAWVATGAETALTGHARMKFDLSCCASGLCPE